ncbi:hypothetical protein AHAS_Ahas13G0392400 [Arachis hypogaea]
MRPQLRRERTAQFCCPVAVVPPHPLLYAPFVCLPANHCLLHRLARMMFKTRSRTPKT